MKPAQRIEFGDFQTPLPLARDICALLQRLGIAPDSIVEPTCGLGSFLLGAAVAFPKASLAGFDINESYVQTTRRALEGSFPKGKFVVRQADFFSWEWDSFLASQPGQLLVLGNPPWVTNSALTSLNGTNLPEKENFLRLRGFAAKTGKSNFDISEWMLIRLLNALRGRRAILAMLCKFTTATKALRYAWQNDGRVASARLYRVSAMEHFDAAVDACLLVARLGESGPAEAEVFPLLDAEQPERRIGMAGRDLVADLAAYQRHRHLEGLCPYQWRSGLKHDCASVMELEPLPHGRFRNKLGETAALEPEFVYPLLKSTDVARGNLPPRRVVIVTQRHTGDDTAQIANEAPLTWSYLHHHAASFRNRKSSIYVGRAEFAIFGIGDYAFQPWKVAVSGLHHDIRFLLVAPHESRPVMFDDTCYYLAFATEAEAVLVANVLNSSGSLAFVRSLVFPGTKRPVTVELLQRLNLAAIAESAGLGVAWRKRRPVSYCEHQQPAQMHLLMERYSTTPSPKRKAKRR